MEVLASMNQLHDDVVTMMKDHTNEVLQKHGEDSF